jgi:hypothetical protein
MISLSFVLDLAHIVLVSVPIALAASAIESYKVSLSL